MLQFFLGGPAPGPPIEPPEEGSVQFEREPIAVNQPLGGGNDYPFVLASELNQVIADAYLYARADRCQFAMPLSVLWVYGFGSEPATLPITPTNPYEILIVDDNGDTVFDSRTTLDFREQNWGDKYKVLQWQTESPSMILRVVKYLDWQVGVDPLEFPIYFEPTSAYLDERVVEFTAPNLRSIRLDPLLGQITDKIKFQAGYNMNITATARAVTNGGRMVNEITFDMVPGAGMGKFDTGCNEEAPLIRLINGVGADANGNLQLDCDQCHRIERPIHELLDAVTGEVAVIHNTLQFLNDCQPCCHCDNYVNTYEGVRRLTNRYKDLYERAIATRDQLVVNIDRFNAQRECRLANSVQATIRPGCGDELLVVVKVCNRNTTCLDNIVMICSFDYLDQAGDFEPGSTTEPLSATTTYSGGIPPLVICESSFRAGNFDANPQQGLNRVLPVAYQPGGEYPHFYAVWDRLQPGSAGTFTFRLGFLENVAGDSVEMILDAYSVPNGKAVPPSGSALVSPVPGYEFGAGPLTPEAKSYRIIPAAQKLRSGLLQSECCPAEE